MALSPETQALLNQWAALCDTDTAGTAAPALTAGSDSNGSGYNIGDLVVSFPDGTRACIPAKIVDTFANIYLADAAGIDSYDNAYPAGTVLIEDTEGDIACISKYIPDQDLFKIGDTLPATMVGTVDIILDNGSVATLAAGDPIPANSASSVYVDEVTGEAACLSKPIVDQDLYKAGDTLPADMVGAIEIILNDGNTVSLSAGDLVPANSASSVIVDEVTGAPECISKSIVDQDLYKPGDTLPADMVGTVDVILEDGTPVTLAAGDVVPATSTGAVYVDEVTGAPRCIGAKISKKELFSGIATGNCADAVSFLQVDAEGNCASFDLKSVLPVTIVDSCEGGEEIGVVDGVPTLDIPELVATELYREQWGSHVFPTAASTLIDPANFPAQIPVPAHNPDCVLKLQVTYGGQLGTGPVRSVDLDTVTYSGTDISQPSTMIYNQVVAPRVNQSIYFFDGLTGAAGSSVTLDFQTFVTDANGEVPGVIQVYWEEICNSSGSALRVADFDTANAVAQSVDTTGLTAPATVVSDEFDMGDCPASITGAARHVVRVDGSTPSTLNSDTEWFDVASGYTETYDTTSFNDHFACQAGSGSGVIAAGSGTNTYSYTSNNALSGSAMYAVPVLCNEIIGPGAVTAAKDCATQLENTNCQCPTMSECNFKASVELTVPAGETLYVSPTFNGIIDTNAVFDVVNDTAEDITRTVCVSGDMLDSTNVYAPGAIANLSAGLAFNGIGSYKINSCKMDCKLIPVAA